MNTTIAQPQLEKIVTQLNQLSHNITREDRKALKKKHGLTSATVSNYLNNRGYNTDTALLMLTFFRERIEAREALIAKTIQPA